MTASLHPEAGLESLHRQLRLLNDRDELTRLCDRYVHHLDKDRASDAWLDGIFTEDVHLTFPFGEFKGLEGLTDFQRMARTTFARTHHISANHTVDLDGDEARVTAHLMAIHVRAADEPAAHFDIGGHYEARARRTPHGWRIHRFVFDLVWQSGEAPQAKTAAS